MSNQKMQFPIVLSQVLIKDHLQIRHLDAWEYARIMIILNQDGLKAHKEAGLYKKWIELDPPTIRAALREGVGNKHRALRGTNIHIDNVLELLPNSDVKVLTIIENRDTGTRRHFVDEFPAKTLEMACLLHDAFNIGMRVMRIKRDAEMEGAGTLVGNVTDVINDAGRELTKIVFDRRQEEQRLKATAQEQETHRQEEQRKRDETRAAQQPVVATPTETPVSEALPEESKPTPPPVETAPQEKPRKAMSLRERQSQKPKPVQPPAETASETPSLATRPSKPRMQTVGKGMEGLGNIKLPEPDTTPPAEATSNGVRTTETTVSEPTVEPSGTQG